ncbi:uncharacterized protein LOC132045149 [Lycium ferocissimum]|uniref:uncharacterized protein LOC132045149 n=1 Tax=Lycium ferocissimum TaxID=112874 RepID=UPI002814E273|nr:uncharacterized protein LOC132045149 [Lycium ferocissimum]
MQGSDSFDFDEIKVYCVFNPITGAHQLIPYPEPTTFMIFGNPGLAVDYSSSDQYKLVTISKLAENPKQLYKFNLLLSEQSGLWREFQLRSNTFSDLAVGSPPVYCHGSLHWLRSDGVAQGLLTLVCIFEKSVAISTYDCANSNWRVPRTFDDVVSAPDGIINGFPILIDSKRVFFVVKYPLAMYDLYEYDSEISRYRKAAVLDIVNYPLHTTNISQSS